jgi:hypothetical protein
VQIKQKTVKDTPFDKLQDAFILRLTGAHRMVEINTQVRAAPARCQAFGKAGCAEQSVVQDTLDACTDANVEQMQQAIPAIFQKHSRAFRHDYQTPWQILDMDLSGRVCGERGEDATKGYFTDQKGAYGRQEGRVTASLSEETVCVRLFTGNTTTAAAVQPLLQDAHEALQLTPEQRAKTIVRLDAGGGTVAEVNACLEAGYHFHGKDISTKRAKNLAHRVVTWYADPNQPGRQVGLGTQEATDYVRPRTRSAGRWWTQNGAERGGVCCSPPSRQPIC